MNPEPTGADGRPPGGTAKTAIAFFEWMSSWAWWLLLGSMAAYVLGVRSPALAYTSGVAALALTGGYLVECILWVRRDRPTLQGIGSRVLGGIRMGTPAFLVLMWVEVAFLAGARGRLMACMAVAGVLLIAVPLIVEYIIDYIKGAGVRAEPCTHGVRGALHKPRRCPECVRLAGGEKELKAKLAAEEEARRRTAAAEAKAEEARRRQESYAAYVASIRLPQYLQNMDPRKFELLVCRVYGRLGYAARPTPYVGDGGVDGFLKRDGKLYLLQCKRVKGSVGSPVLQQLSGCISHHNATGGIVVTTGTVSTQARSWAKHNKIDIVELDAFVRMVREVYPEGEVVPDSWQAAPPVRARPAHGYRGRSYWRR